MNGKQFGYLVLAVLLGMMGFSLLQAELLAGVGVADPTVYGTYVPIVSAFGVAGIVVLFYHYILKKKVGQ